MWVEIKMMARCPDEGEEIRLVSLDSEGEFALRGIMHPAQLVGLRELAEEGIARITEDGGSWQQLEAARALLAAVEEWERP